MASSGQSLAEEMAEHRGELDSLAARFVGREEDEMTLFRFARGYKWNVDDASRALEATLAWKAEKGVDAAFQTRCRASKQRELTHAELVMTYYPHNIHHKDCPNGAPLSLERTAHIDPDSLVANVTFAQFERYHIEHMENKFAQLNRLSKQHDRLVGSVKIMDLDGLSSKHLTNTGRNYLTAAIHISQAHYPEMLNKLIIINTPWVFNMLWAIVKPWLNERTLAKIIVLGSDYRETIKEHLPVDIVPEWAGGLCACAGGCVYEPRPSEPPTAVSVAAGSTHDVTIILPAAGAVATWSFTPTYYDCEYYISYRATKAGEPTVGVVTMTNAAYKQVVQGSFTAPGPGALTITFSNAASYWYAKPIEYRTEVIQPETQQQAAAAAVEQAQQAAQ